MTKLILALLIVLAMFSCTKQAEFEKLMKETDDPVPVKIEIAETQVDEEIPKVLVEEPEADRPEYNDGLYDWDVRFKIFKNHHHPNGYVIISTIKKQKDGEEESWAIRRSASNYIEEVHYKLKAKHHNGGYEENNVFLPENEDFRTAFRTAEAIYIAWIKQGKENPVKTSSVIEARDRMEGRQYGVPIEDQ